MLVALAKKGADWMKVTLPGPVVLTLAAAIAEGINQLATGIVGWELPPGVAGVVAVGIREFYSQLIAQPVGLEEKTVKAEGLKVKVPGQLGGSLVLVLALSSFVACGGDGGEGIDEENASKNPRIAEPSGNENTVVTIDCSGGDATSTNGPATGGNGGDCGNPDNSTTTEETVNEGSEV